MLRWSVEMTFVRRAAALVAPLVLFAGLLVAGPAQAVPYEQVVGKPKCQRTLASYPILRPGDRKAAVRTLQCSLNDVGVGPVVVDGFYGPQTKAAVKEITDGFEGTGARTRTGSTTGSGCCSSAASCRTATSRSARTVRR